MIAHSFISQWECQANIHINSDTKVYSSDIFTLVRSMGILPSLLVTVYCAPYNISSVTSRGWFHRDALCRGVSPRWLVIVTSAPCCVCIPVCVCVCVHICLYVLYVNTSLCLGSANHRMAYNEQYSSSIHVAIATSEMEWSVANGILRINLCSIFK